MQNNQQDKKVFEESDASIKARTTKLDNKLDVEQQWREEAFQYLKSKWAFVDSIDNLTSDQMSFMNAYLAGRKATELDKQKIASEAWDAGRDYAGANMTREPDYSVPDKQTYLNSLK